MSVGAKRIAAHAETFLISLVLRVARLRQIAHLLVLVLRHQSCVHREDVSEQLTKAVGPLHHRRRMVGDVAEVTLELLVRVVLVEPCRQPTQHPQQRTSRPLEFDHLTGQFVDATRNSGIATEYFGFDLVDVVLQAGHHRGVPVDDCVENGIENRPRYPNRNRSGSFSMRVRTADRSGDSL